MWRFQEGLLKDLSSNTSLPFLINNNHTPIRAASLCSYLKLPGLHKVSKTCQSGSAWPGLSHHRLGGKEEISQPAYLTAGFCSVLSHRRWRLLQLGEGQWQPSRCCSDHTLLLPSKSHVTFPLAQNGLYSTFQPLNLELLRKRLLTTVYRPWPRQLLTFSWTNYIEDHWIFH